MLTLIHCTAGRNRRGIKARGLLAGMARGRRKAVWFVPPGGMWDALYHAMKANGGPIIDPTVVTVKLPASWVKHHGKGLYYVERDVPASMFVKVERFKLES